MKPRVAIVLDDDSTINEVLLIPEGISDIDAHNMISAAIERAKDSNPDEWTYDEVIKLLEPVGFVAIDRVCVYE